MADAALQSEYFPAADSGAPELILVPGWASNYEVWRPLLARLRPWASVTLINLPRSIPAGDSGESGGLDEAVETLLSVAPDRAIYIGWSLGGQIVTHLADRHSARVQAVVTVCSNPAFIANGTWPGMASETFRDFRAAVWTNPRAGLRRFDSLQTAGAARPRGLARLLSSTREELDPELLDNGLALLSNLDTREVLMRLRMPQLHLFSPEDQLVPSGVAEALARRVGTMPAQAVVSLSSACHAAPLDVPDEIGSRLREFLEGFGLVSPSATESGAYRRESPEYIAGGASKADVAESFSRAARHYDSAAQLQRDVGDRLLEIVGDSTRNVHNALDLGCGTGHFLPFLRERFPDAALYALDLAPGMIQFARENHTGVDAWLVADGESLPLPSNSVDLIFSSLAIQWCHNPRRLIAEFARVLRPGGRCVFSSLGPETLRELRSSWAEVDDHQHVNRFLPVSALEQACEGLPVTLEVSCEQFRMEYDRVRELLTELKTLGAHNMNRGRLTGLTGRRALQGMLEAYESWREGGKLPATYDVIFGVLEKT